MIGFNLVLPSTNVYKIRVNDDKERRDVVAKLCEQWSDYCTSHWISENHEEPYCAENRVKRFLDGMGYFLLRSDTSGIITDYMEEMNSNREIPVSCCPDFVNDLFFGSGQGYVTQAQKEAMQSLNGYLDEKVKPKKTRKKPSVYEEKRKRRESFEAEFHPNGYKFPIVDTEGNFTVDGVSYHVSENCKQYSPKNLKDDVLYDMDRIIVAQVKDKYYFFDQNFECIDMFVSEGLSKNA